MAIDGKYGRVTLEKGTIGEDEPVVVFRAQDMLLVPLLEEYGRLCVHQGSPERHIDLILNTKDRIEAWQAENPTKVPESVGYEKSQVNPSGA